MYEVLNRNAFLLAQQADWKGAGNYNIHDPESGELLLECREDNLNVAISALRDFHPKLTPFKVQIRLPTGQSLLLVSRKGSVTFPKPITARMADGYVVGVFKQKLLSKVTDSYEIYGPNAQLIYNMKCDLWELGWRFYSGDVEQAKLVLAKNLSAAAAEATAGTSYNCVIHIHPAVPANSLQRQLILSASIGAHMSFNRRV